MQPCPQCHQSDQTPVGFTWWGGLLGPKMFQLVTCNHCRHQFSAKDGRPASVLQVRYLLVSGGIAAVLLVGGLCVLGMAVLAGR